MKKTYNKWLICLGCALAMFCSSGLFINAFSSYMPHLIERYGLTQTQASYITMTRTVLSLVGKMTVLFVIRKIEVRKTMGLGLVLTVAAFALYAAAPSAVFVYIAAALAGLGNGLCTMIPASIVLNRWFSNKLASALAFCAMSTGIAALVVPPIIVKSIAAMGMSKTFLFEGVAAALLGALTFLFVKDYPQDVIGVIHGGAAEHTGKKEKKQISVFSPARRVVFLLVPFLLGGIVQIVPNLFSLHFIGQGYSEMIAATGVSGYGVTLIISKIIYGFSTERIGYEATDKIFAVLGILGAILNCVVAWHVSLIYIATILLGMIGALSTVGISMWAKLFSTKEGYDDAVQQNQIATMVGAIIMAPLSGALADITGSYVAVFGLFAVMLTAVFIILHSTHKAYKRIKA